MFSAVHGLGEGVGGAPRSRRGTRRRPACTAPGLGRGLSGRLATSPPTPLLSAQDTLSAKSWYAGPDAVCEANRQPVAMAGRRAIHRGKIGGAGRGKRSRRNKPPDLPSLLLDSRICYIGMPVRGASEGQDRGWEGVCC